jgi:polyisoprenoid-binding protein YceI
MHAPSGHLTAPPLEALLTDGALAGEWVVDPHASSIRLKSSVLGGLIRVHGVFRRLSGDGVISAGGAVSGTLTVASAAIDTKNARRDTHLRSADFFDSDRNPDITFTADGVRLTGRGIRVSGVLTVRDRTRPLTFDAAASVHDAGSIHLDTEVRVNREDFGLTWNLLGMVSANSTVAIHAVFTRR